jgi:ribosome-associated translation inhibitor RaiA
MDIPVQISYRNLQPSDAVSARVREEVGKLGRYYDRIERCHVVIEVPHRHHRWGDHYHLRVTLSVPGNDIVVVHEPSDRSRLAAEGAVRSAKSRETAGAHTDMYVVIRDVFDTVRRRLEDHSRRLRGDVKRHRRADLMPLGTP